MIRPPPPSADSLAARLRGAWQRSDAIFDLLADGALFERPIALRHPFLFYLGHLPAFGWNQLGASALGRPPLHPEFDRLFERGIDPLDDAEAEAARIDPSRWPAVERVVAYRDRARAAMLAALPEVVERADPPLLEGGRVVEIVAEHEEMHHETLMYMLQRLDPARLVPPAGVSLPSAPGGGAEPGRATIPAGTVRLGARWQDLPFGWDNEFPAVDEAVSAFELDVLPVTIERYRAFVEDGGYARRELWDAAGWTWRERAGIEAPGDWRRDDGAWRIRWLFGELDLDDVGAWPVFASHAEASAFARWAGRRLPTEAELHRAAWGRPGGEEAPWPWGEEPPSAERAHAGFDRWHPEPVGARPRSASAWGVQDLLGNGWEWTDTPFLPRPGFRAWMPGYPGYSADFFDGEHLVIFGGAWPTARGMLRRTFRNWFQPRYPHVFAGFRLAS